jgi:hypothetical protein
MLYFNTLPKILTADQNGNYVLMTNLLTRAKLLEELQNNPMLFYQYSIQDGDTPEIVADKYYGDSYRYWIILYSNQILDPLWDWPLNNEQFLAYLDSKYAVEAEAEGKTPFEYTNLTIKSYNKLTTTKDTISEIEVVQTTSLTEADYNSLVPTTTTYTLSDGSTSTVTISKEAVTIYDYEYQTNENKRLIKVMNELYVPQMETQLRTLMSQ